MGRRPLGASIRFIRTGLCAGVALLVLGTTAQGAVVLQDTYYGGIDTYNNPNDLIGPASVFDIVSAVIDRVGSGGNTLQVTINTNFAGKPGTADADGTGYGALFLTPGVNAWHPTGTAPNYPEDTYQPGEWQYAFTIPQVPNSSSGTGGLYLTSAGTIQLSNVFNDTVTYPFPGNNGYYFRQNQAVQFTPNYPNSPVANGTWTVGLSQLVFDITDNHLLGDNFALSWAITCANDVIQGQVSGVPEPATWVMMIFGFGMIGVSMRRRKNAVGSTALGAMA